MRHTNEPRLVPLSLPCLPHLAPLPALAPSRALWNSPGTSAGREGAMLLKLKAGPCPASAVGLEIGMNPPLRERAAQPPSSHFHLQPVPACVGEGSIYSALFLAPSSEEPDSQLMTGTHRSVSARLWGATLGADVLRLKVAASGNVLLPWEVELFGGFTPLLSENLHLAPKDHLVYFWCSK